MSDRGLIVGGGIAGLAAAVALSRVAGPGTSINTPAGKVCLWERADDFQEVGAGVQLGPNATRVLHAWGLGTELSRFASEPESLTICSVLNNEVIAKRELGLSERARYGAPSYTIHRADLHRLLLNSVLADGVVDLKLGRQLTGLSQDHQTHQVIAVQRSKLAAQDHEERYGWLLGCDGGFSQVRALSLKDGAPQPTGQIAYRAVIPMANVRQVDLRHRVTAWLGPNMHAVAYPIKSGELLNLVVLVQNHREPAPEGWDLRPVVQGLPLPTEVVNRDLNDLVGLVAEWRYWVLCGRSPVRGIWEMHPTEGVALLGDAAHPMLPFLAQGAAMAIEDAHQLGVSLAKFGDDQRQAFLHFAQARWRRNAQVQAGALKNASIFHFKAPISWARDTALKVLGQRLLDQPWLYGAPLPSI